MLNMESLRESGISKLNEWRNRYDRVEYPGKVVINIFYELFGIEGVWRELSTNFSGEERTSDFGLAYQHVVYLKRNYQIQSLRDNLQTYLNQDKVVCGVKYSDWRNDIKLASKGSNADVIDIEYSYWYYNQYCLATLHWAALGLMGFDKHSAFREISGGDIEGFKADTFSDILKYLSQVLGLEFDGHKDLNGNKLDLIAIMNNSNIKSYPASFTFLPKLWS